MTQSAEVDEQVPNHMKEPFFFLRVKIHPCRVEHSAAEN